MANSITGSGTGNTITYSNGTGGVIATFNGTFTINSNNSSGGSSGFTTYDSDGLNEAGWPFKSSGNSNPANLNNNTFSGFTVVDNTGGKMTQSVDSPATTITGIEIAPRSSITFTGGQSNVADTPYGSYANGFGLIVTNSCSISGGGTINGSTSSGTTTSIAPIIINGPDGGNSGDTNVTIENITINAPTGYVTPDGHYSNDNTSSLAIGIAGPITCTVGSGANVTGAPAVMVAGAGKLVSNGNGTSKTNRTTLKINSGANLKGNGRETDQAVVRNYGADFYGYTEIDIQGGTITGTSSQPGIYAPSDNGVLNISGGNISGCSGVVVRGGEITTSWNSNNTEPIITGTGVSSSNPGVLSDSGSGAAISILGCSATALSDGAGDATVNIKGGDLISEQGYSVDYLAGEAGNISPIDSSNQNPISFGNTNGNGPSLVSKKQTSPINFPSGTNPNGGTYSGTIGNGTTCSPSPAKSDISPDVTNVVVLPDNSVKLFDDDEEAQTFANANDGINLPNTTAGLTYPGAYSPSDTSGYIYSVNFDPETTLNYYNTGDNGSTQSYALNLDLMTGNSGGNKYNNITPEMLTYSVSTVGSTVSGSNTFNFGSGWQNADENGTPITLNLPVDEGYRVLYADNPNENWYLMYEYTITQGSKVGDPAIVEWSNLTLNYNGTDSTSTGVYSMTGQASSGYYSTNVTGANSPKGSFSFIVNDTNVDEVQILGPNNQEVTGIFSVDLSTTNTVDFGYIAYNDDEITQGHVVEWNLINPNNTENDYSSLPYATVNKDSGVVTFFRSLPTNTILILTVTVDGQTSNQVILQTTGELNYDQTTGIASIYNPLTISTASGNSYPILNNNIVTIPYEIPVSSGTLTFESSNPNFMVFSNSSNNSTSGTPVQYQLIPMSGNTGTTTITATWTTPDNQTFTTEFEVNFVSNNVSANGVTAANSLTFAMTNPASQNVKASLTPVNNTVQAGNLGKQGNGFRYSSCYY